MDIILAWQGFGSSVHPVKVGGALLEGSPTLTLTRLPTPPHSLLLFPQYLLSDQRFPVDLWMAIGYKEVAFYPQGKAKPLRSFLYEQ